MFYFFHYTSLHMNVDLTNVEWTQNYWMQDDFLCTGLPSLTTFICPSGLLLPAILWGSGKWGSLHSSLYDWPTGRGSTILGEGSGAPFSTTFTSPGPAPPSSHLTTPTTGKDPTVFSLFSNTCLVSAYKMLDLYIIFLKCIEYELHSVCKIVYMQ